MADAVDLELVNRNVAARPKGLPPARRVAPRAWSPEQLRTFLQGTAGDRLFPLWRLIAVTGCRRGEALGLSGDEVDLDAGLVTIMRQRAIAGGSVVEGTPKTNAGARTVAIDRATSEILRSWRRPPGRRARLHRSWAGSTLSWSSRTLTGPACGPRQSTARFREQAEALGLPLIGLHGLRHTAASAMIAAGVNPRVVQQRLGHAHVSVTLGLYTHVSARSRRGRCGPPGGDDRRRFCDQSVTKRKPTRAKAAGQSGAPPGIRTQNLRIKSPLLCH